MGRLASRLTVVLFLSCCGYAFGQVAVALHDGGAERAAHPAADGLRGDVSALLTGLHDRQHPHGLEADDSPRWSPTWGSLWKGGGRHAVWRGCRHVYDAAMTAFLNAPPRTAMGSGT